MTVPPSKGADAAARGAATPGLPLATGEAIDAILGMIDFEKAGGLVPVVAQDSATGRVLMVAYANADAVRASLETGEMTYWSRSRGRLWRKGKESGHTQRLVALRRDCDGDALLAIVEQRGPACHTGARTCFQSLPPLAGEAEAGLGELERILLSRKAAPVEGSHTSRLLSDENFRLKKIGEESAEVVLAAKEAEPDRLTEEVADLIYHSLVAGIAVGVTPDDVLRELARRRRSPSA
jgi:phosphoribosyl-ATP pyrophosphohydrolase/phosphoribosyl-AMP cyclohydrolase